jgi:hypothetical protein
VEASGGLIQSMTMAIENALRPQRAIGTGGNLAGMGNGRFALTGQVTVYFNGLANPIYTAYKNNQPIELKIELPDAEGNAYNITLFKVELMNLVMPANGIDQDVVMIVDYQAVLGGADSKTIEVERVIAP